MLWFMGIIFSFPQLLSTYVVPFKYGNQSYLDCREDWGDNLIGAQIYTLFLFLLTFLCPMIVLSFVYSLIGYRITKRIPINDLSLSLSSDCQGGTLTTRQSCDQRSQSTVKVCIKLIIILIILFYFILFYFIFLF